MRGRAAVFHEAERPLELAASVIPELRCGEILVHVSACGLCRSDLHSHAGRRRVATPSVLGHEIVGRIAAFGPGTQQVDYAGQAAAVGDRITWSIVLGCGECFYCRRDLPQKCVRLYKYGHEPIDPARPLGGGLADHAILLPRTAWLRLPEGISDEVAALANCSAATAAAVVRCAGAVADQTVVVLGAGVLGTMACATLHRAGAREVWAVDPHRPSRERALRFGATRAFDSGAELSAQVLAASDGVGADVVLELAGGAASSATSLALVRLGGVVVWAGSVSPSDAIAVVPEAVVRGMITLRGMHNYHPRDLQAAVAMLAEDGGRFPFEELVAERFPLERMNKALERRTGFPACAWSCGRMAGIYSLKPQRGSSARRGRDDPARRRFEEPAGNAPPV